MWHNRWIFLNNIVILMLFSALSSNESIANAWLRLPNCSGVVARMPGMLDNDKALVITNAHCIFYTLSGDYTIEKKSNSDQPAQVTEKRKSQRIQPSQIILSNQLIHPGGGDPLYVQGDIYVYSENNQGLFGEYVRLTYSKIIYAKVKDVDLAILELETTYLELKSKNINYYPVSRSDPKESAEIVFHTANAALREQLPLDMSYPAIDQAVGGPAARAGPVGPDGSDSNFREIKKCKIEKYAPSLKEYVWTFKNYMRLQASSSCRFEPGVSGTAGIYNGEIVALASTVYEGAQPCSLANPCEIDAAGAISVAPDFTGYAMPTAQLYKCYDENEKFQFGGEKKDCDLGIAEDAPR